MPSPGDAKRRATVTTPFGVGTLLYWPVPAAERKAAGRSGNKAVVALANGRHKSVDPDKVHLTAVPVAA